MTSPRLAAVIAKAASFPERAGPSLFTPVASSNTEDVEPRVRRWLRTAAEDAAARRAVMEHLVAKEAVLGAGLRTVRLRDPECVPSWAEPLTTFLAAQPADESTASGAANTVLSSFLRAGRALVPRIGGLIEGVEVTDDGYQGILDDLVQRLIEVCDPALRFEMQLALPATNPRAWLQTPDLDTTQAGWLRRLEMLPTIAFVMGVACEQWRGSVREILGRLRADSALLRHELFEDEAPGALVGFKGGAGDRHANGRSVALLRFSSGRGLVYKPKDLRHVDATMGLIRHLDGKGLSLPLPTRGVVCRGDYGWEGRIEPAPVTDRDGFQRFYRRLGMLIRLMQLLNARDLWADNLLAQGDEPHVIDLECLFSPPIHPPPLLSPRRQALVERLESTVVRTAMPLQAWLPSPECPTRDLGCLSHASDPLEAGGGALRMAPYRPWLGTETADPWSHAEDVCDGYREMDEVLRAQREALLSEDGPLKAFEGARMRYIWRNTWDCHKLLRSSVSPAALVDGTARETVLALLFRGAFTVTREAHQLDLPGIAAAEIDAFRRLDIPLFTSLTTSSSLFTPEGTELPGHFAGSAWVQVRRRIATLDQAPIEAEVAILRAAIDAARGGTDLPLSVSAPTPSSKDAEPSADEVMAAIQAIADLLWNARRPPLGTGGGWIGLLWWPVPDMWEVAPAVADLISGALGPALFLADHFALTGDPRSWTASRETMDELFELARAGDRGAPDPRLALGAPVPGGLAGPGALCYAAARIGVALSDPSLVLAARGHVELAAAVAERPQAGDDLAFGVAGLALNLLRLRRDSGPADPDVDRLIARLTDRLLAILAAPESAPNHVPIAQRLGELVPIGRDAVAFALARSVAVAPELSPDRAAVASSLERHTFDLARRGGRLAAMAVHAFVPKTSSLRAATRLDDSDLHRRSTRALLSMAEEAQIAARITDAPDAARDAGRCIRVLLDRRAATGRWFPDRLVDDRLNLSALDGVPALGSMLLRHLRPQLPLTSVLE